MGKATRPFRLGIPPQRGQVGELCIFNKFIGAEWASPLVSHLESRPECFSLMKAVFPSVTPCTVGCYLNFEMMEIEELSDILAENALKSEFLDIKSDYYPETLLDELINEEAVRRQLSVSGAAQPPDFESIVNFCKERGRKLFCITLLAWRNSNVIEPVRFFMENGFEDMKLSAEVDDQGDRSCSCLDVNQLQPPLWRGFAVSRVLKLQWEFLIPVFSTKDTNYSFAREVVLPFKKIGSGGKIFSGTFSTVHKVMIQPGHLIDIDDKASIPQYIQPSLLIGVL